MAFYVYGVINTNNGKLYIGKSNKPQIRWNQHKVLALKGSNDCPKLYGAIRKYGIENFEHYIIQEFKFETEALEVEKYYIRYFDAIKFGYNCLEDVDSRVGYVVSPEAKQKMSLAKKGKKASDTTRHKMSESRLGKLLPQAVRDKISASHKGKIVSKETRQKLSLLYKGKRFSIDTEIKPGTKPACVKINQQMVEDIKKDYDSGVFTQRSLARKYNVSKTTISNVLKNKYSYKYSE